VRNPPSRFLGTLPGCISILSETYGIRLSDQQRKMFTAWNTMDPPGDWEQERNGRIARIQEKGNRFIEE
jgi:deoxyribonuclease-1